MEIGTPDERRARVTRTVPAGRAAARSAEPVPAPVLGRPAPAHFHRPRADHEPRNCWSATSRCRALDVAIQAQILNLLARLQDGTRPELSVHQPRPWRGASCLRRRGGDVSGQDRRDGPARCAVRRAAASLYTGAACRRPPVWRGASRAAMCGPSRSAAIPPARSTRQKAAPLPTAAPARRTSAAACSPCSRRAARQAWPAIFPADPGRIRRAARHPPSRWRSAPSAPASSGAWGNGGYGLSSRGRSRTGRERDRARS